MSKAPELSLRLIVLEPPSGVRFAVQRGKNELLRPTSEGPTSLQFDIVLRLGRRPDGAPNFLGPYAQGPAAARFVYVNSGTRAGQTESSWRRRAKVPLTGIRWAQIEALHTRPGAVLEVRVAGRSKDGGPVCGSVRLGTDAWRVVS